MHKEKKRIDFWVRQLLHRRDQLNAYDLYCCCGYGGIDSNIDGLQMGFTRTSPEDFDFLLALGNSQISWFITV